MKIQYCNKTGLLFLEGVPFTIERLRAVINFFNHEHQNSYEYDYTEQFEYSITIKDISSKQFIHIKEKHIDDIIQAMSMYDIASNKDF